MKLSFVQKAFNGVKRVGSKALFVVKKASPEICLVGGVVAIVGGTVLACVATKKIVDIVNDADRSIDEVKSLTENGSITHEEEENAIKSIRTHAFWNITRYAAPAVSLEIAGIALVCTAHGIMRKRNGALLAAYNALEASFREYKNRMEPYEKLMIADQQKKALAEAQNLALANGVTMTQEEIDNLNKQVADKIGPLGPYNFIFSSETSGHWHPHAASNRNVLTAAEAWATRELESRGHLFLNDVLDYLKMPLVPWGQFVGWLRGGQNSDGYVEMISDDYKRDMDLDDDSWNNPILLTFNCDGMIWDKI